jgi:hypothetical protein
MLVALFFYEELAAKVRTSHLHMRLNYRHVQI